jgi:dTDP-4-amino-4,6-dideoxygalactose transaminase
MNVPFVDLQTPSRELADAYLVRAREICESAYFTQGPFVEQFEKDFAAYCGTEHCIALNTGTSALHLALAALGIGPGDEVITVPMTFIATSWGISYTGAVPVFVDVDPRLRTMNPEQIEAKINARTRAILPVHLYGQPADMLPILQIAEQHGLAVIEDAAQAHGARYLGRRAGSLADAGCFSFYPSKNLGAFGEGGAVVTNSDRLADTIRSLRNHGQGATRNQHDAVGYNYRMDALQGAALGLKLPYLESWNAQRQERAEQYLKRLQNVPGIGLPQVLTDRESVYHLFVVTVDNRNEIAAELAEAGIQTAVHYPTPVHLQPAYQHLGYQRGDFPHAEYLGSHGLSLPMYPGISEEQVDYVAERLIAAVTAREALSVTP